MTQIRAERRWHREQTPGADVLERTRQLLPSLSPSSRQVAEAVLARPTEIVSLPATGLAEASGTSVGSVVRFCHAIGLSGYQDFKDRLFTCTVSAPAPLLADRPGRRAGTVDAVMTATLVGLARAADSIDERAIRRAADLLRDARRILIPSSGPSQPIAMALGQSLSYAGYAVSYPTDAETQIASAQTLGAQDVLLAISHSGTTARTLDSVRAAAAAGASVVALTSYLQSPLSDLADVAIVAGSDADSFRTRDAASRPVHLVVVQALVAILTSLDETP